MEIHVKNLKDEHGINEYVFYESVNFAKPIMILTEDFAKRLHDRLGEEIEKEDWKYGRHS